MIRAITFAFVAAFTTLSLAPAIAIAAAPAASPEGRWQTTTGESRFEVSYCGGGGQICAKLVWLRDDARTAENLQYLNRYVVEGARPVAANKWRGTVNYDGRTVGGSVTLVNASHMKVQGCQFIVCESLEFRRV